MAGMMSSGEGTAASVYVELSLAIVQLRSRGLQQSVKWAAEQLVGLPEEVWEAGAAQAAKLAAAQQEPEHPKLVQGRCFFELKVGRVLVRCLRVDTAAVGSCCN